MCLVRPPLITARYQQNQKEQKTDKLKESPHTLLNEKYVKAEAKVLSRVYPEFNENEYAACTILFNTMKIIVVPRKTS